MKTRNVVLAGILFLLFGSQLPATTINLAPPSGTVATNGNSLDGVDRGLIFTALENFSIISAGIDIGCLVTPGCATALEVDIWTSDTAGNRTTLLKSGTISGIPPVTANHFVDVPINFDFINGSTYDIAFYQTAPNPPSSFGNGYNTMTFTTTVPADFPYTISPYMTVYMGSHGDPGIAMNVNDTAQVPHIELETGTSTVPEPSSILFLGTGLIAIIGYGLRKR